MEPIYNASGKVVGWMKGRNIYHLNGEHAAVVNQGNVHGNNGQYLGVFKDGLFRDHRGQMVAFVVALLRVGIGDHQLPVTAMAPVPPIPSSAPAPTLHPIPPIPAIPSPGWGIDWSDFITRKSDVS